MPPPSQVMLRIKELAREVDNKAKKNIASTHNPYLGNIGKNGSGKNKRTFKKRTFKKRTLDKKKRTLHKKKRTLHKKKRTFNKRKTFNKRI
jgi:hypothetical protein